MDGLTNSAPRILLKLMVWFRFYREYEGEYIHTKNLFEKMRGNILGDHEGIGWGYQRFAHKIHVWLVYLPTWMVDFY